MLVLVTGQGRVRCSGIDRAAMIGPRLPLLCLPLGSFDSFMPSFFPFFLQLCFLSLSLPPSNRIQVQLPRDGGHRGIEESHCLVTLQAKMEAWIDRWLAASSMPRCAHRLHQAAPLIILYPKSLDLVPIMTRHEHLLSSLLLPASQSPPDAPCLSKILSFFLYSVKPPSPFAFNPPSLVPSSVYP